MKTFKDLVDARDTAELALDEIAAPIGELLTRLLYENRYDFERVSIENGFVSFRVVYQGPYADGSNDWVNVPLDEVEQWIASDDTNRSIEDYVSRLKAQKKLEDEARKRAEDALREQTEWETFQRLSKKFAKENQDAIYNG